MIKKICRNIYFSYKYKGNISFISSISKNIKLEEGITISSFCSVYCESIGKYTFIGKGTKIDANTSRIGRFCSISSDVKIGLGSHPYSFISTHPFCYAPHYGFVENLKFDEYKDKGFTVIGNDVLISANAIILAGVIIGDGAIIGAGAVVTKNVEPYSVVAGVPAKIIRYRFTKEYIAKLLETKWWNFSDTKLKQKINFFNNIKNISKL